MPSNHLPLFLDSYLHAEFDGELHDFQSSGEDAALLARLKDWAEREMQNEVSAQGAFVDRFFKQTWGYWAAGERPAAEGYTCYPQFAVGRAGAAGGTGQADLALGFFGTPSLPPIPQALCEFKDIRSDLDSPQRRKGSTRSPVQQCTDYLREAAAPLTGAEQVQIHWGIVTDMNEFRLYRRTSLMRQYQRFVIAPKADDDCISLLEKTTEASFQRLVFSRLFARDRLIAPGGDPPLIRDLKRQLLHERSLEDSFYAEYRAYRELLIDKLRGHNPNFPGTPGKLVRLAQTILDRCIFVLFCEDMGRSLSFPKSLLRDYLISRSLDSFYDPAGEEIWATLRRLFAVMNTGGQFLTHRINRFNGGLFLGNLELDSLRIPNSVFCLPGQGGSATNLAAFPRTLLYFSAQYNFGVSAEGRTITLYALGRIFEQSITELEVLEADAEGRPSLTLITKRKRDGVYYTPEWVIEKIVTETLGPRLADLRLEAGWDETEVLSDDAIRRKSSQLNRQVAAITRYRELADAMTVVDPACGSGAFLIYAMDYLLSERRRVTHERERLSQQPILFDTEAEIRQILSRNIYGVDINPASIEITRLALWLHTARGDRPLCDLNRNIRDGNSLISPSQLADWDNQMLLLPPEEQERINAFDWQAAFPEVWERGGFDCVVGNPPYVKLQNFKRVMPKVAKFLREAKNGSQPLYRSAQSGNFDIYLPFIEKGISLLNLNGRMGFIAPSLWLLNEYGEGLRTLVHEGRNLDRWLDFKSFQVFDEAITYTALQFFTRSANASVRFASARDGVSTSDWNDSAWRVPYSQLSAGGDTWVLLPEHERGLLRRLASECRRLDDPAVSVQIFQGLITSADSIYHLQKIRSGHYLSRANKETRPVEVEMEDSILRPLISGPEVDRYVELATDTYLLFPYDVQEQGASLFTAEQMQEAFPKAWRYLKKHEKRLRLREQRAFDDGMWYRFGRNQSIDKQHLPKLAVAQMVQHLEVSHDLEGKFCLNNVRVNGILCEKPADLLFLSAILNSKLPDWIFRRIAAPKAGDYFEANKQFIAPLPIPDAPVRERRWIGTQAVRLSDMHTRLRKLESDVDRRLDGCHRLKRGEEWVLPRVGSVGDWAAHAPKGLRGRARIDWAKEHRRQKLDDECRLLQTRLGPRSELTVECRNGELLLLRNGVPLIEKVFVAREEAEFLGAQWQIALWTMRPDENPEALRLVDFMRNLVSTEDAQVRQQVVELCREENQLRAEIDEVEGSLNKRIYALYRLSETERAMIEQAR